MAATLAIQISPHFYYAPIEATAVSIEYRGVEHVLPWPDKNRYPTSEILSDSKGQLIPVQHSPQEHDIWHSSTFVSYGVYAQIRQLNSETDFPMVKLASRHADARKHIQNEFRLLRRLSQIPSVVKIHDVALVDDQGIFGFRMEKLLEIPTEDRPKYICQIQEAVGQVHNAGVAHCDLTFSNIMMKNNRVKLIDFGLSGTLGETLPQDHLLRRMYGFDTFSTTIDGKRLDTLKEVAAEA
jgi:serine/threonine protein kinase